MPVQCSVCKEDYPNDDLFFCGEAGALLRCGLCELKYRFGEFVAAIRMITECVSQERLVELYVELCNEHSQQANPDNPQYRSIAAMKGMFGFYGVQCYPMFYGDAQDLQRQGKKKG